MNVIRTIATELYGLFVDDGVFALAILIWVGIVAALVHFTSSGAWQGPVLFGGVALLLLENVHRSSRK